MQEPALQSILQKGWFISTFPRRSARAYIITLTSEAISAQPKPFCIRCRRESWEMLCEGGRQERKDLSWLTHPFCVNVWMPYCIFMSCRGLLNTNATSHHVPSHKLFFYQTSVPLCPDFIIHIPVPSHTGGSVLACFPPFFCSNMMKPLLKCQYSPQYPPLAARHFIFTLKYGVISPQVNVSPGVTLSLSVFPHRAALSHTHAHIYIGRGRETSWNCLISPSFNYLPSCPWDGAKGSVLMSAGSIEKKDKDCGPPSPLLCLLSTAQPAPLFVWPGRVCALAIAGLPFHKWGTSLALKQPPFPHLLQSRQLLLCSGLVRSREICQLALVPKVEQLNNTCKYADVRVGQERGASQLSLKAHSYLLYALKAEWVLGVWQNWLYPYFHVLMLS